MAGTTPGVEGGGWGGPPPRTRTQQDKSQPSRGGKTRREEHISWEETLVRCNTSLRVNPALPLWGFGLALASSVLSSFLFVQLTPSCLPTSISGLSPCNQPAFYLSPSPAWNTCTSGYSASPHMTPPPAQSLTLEIHTAPSFCPIPSLPTSDLPGSPVSGLPQTIKNPTTSHHPQPPP